MIHACLRRVGQRLRDIRSDQTPFSSWTPIVANCLHSFRQNLCCWAQSWHFRKWFSFFGISIRLILFLRLCLVGVLVMSFGNSVTGKGCRKMQVTSGLIISEDSSALLWNVGTCLSRVFSIFGTQESQQKLRLRRWYDIRLRYRSSLISQHLIWVHFLVPMTFENFRSCRHVL